MWSDFHKLEAGISHQFYAADPIDDIPDEYVCAMENYPGKLRIGVYKGGRPGDIIAVGWPGLLIVSDRVLEVLQQHQFQSYATYPVEVICLQQKLPRYHGLVALGKGGHFLPDESGVEYGPVRPDGTRGTMGMERLAFDTTEWDGSDVFRIPEYPCLTVVTENVKKAFKKAKLTNCSFESLEDHSY